VQDIATMRTLPNMTVYSPADPGETSECLRVALQRGRPSYLRLGKAGEASLHEPRDISRGPIKLREGSAQVAFAATGSVLKATLEAASLLAKSGIDAAVYSCPVLSQEKPDLFQPLWSHRVVVSVEEHGFAGGFGSFLKELSPAGTHVKICAIPDANAALVGSQDFLRKQAGLDADSLARVVLDLDLK